MFHIPTAFNEISGGDKDAIELLNALYLFFHKQDDLIDRDKPVEVEHSIGCDLQVLRAFGKNPLFQKHQDFLWPLIMTSALAYAASEDLKKRPDVIDRITSQVLKSQYVDIFFGIAFCVGGFPHALAMSKKYRDYHFDNEKPTV